MMIERATPETLAELHAGLCALLEDAVEGGASIGFVLPLADGELDRYLDGIRADAEHDTRIVLVARDGAGVAGMVQLELAAKANARHRAEVQKLLVARRARRRGLGTRLMTELESAAQERGRTLLVLDTISGSEADPLYRGLGYLEAGSIPRYAAMPWGELAPTTVFFKELDARDGSRREYD
jgi:acetyltransferase